jgi:hypothetical protein
MKTIYVIEAHTGCTCCANENHYRGPYKTREDAQRRIDYYYSKDSKYWPLASQYAKRGHYYIREMTAEPISGDRWIIDDDTVIYGLNFIEVHEDGTVLFNEGEIFSEIS